MPYQMLFAQFA